MLAVCAAVLLVNLAGFNSWDHSFNPGEVYVDHSFNPGKHTVLSNRVYVGRN